MTFSAKNLPKLVIFDNDGVLIDSEIIAATAASQVLAEFGYGMAVDEVMHAFIGMSGQAMRTEMTKRGIVVDEQYETRATEVFLAMTKDRLTAIAGARELVHALNQANIPVCVCSNAGEQWLVNTHQQLGLDSVFDPRHYFHRDMVSNPKPAPDMHQMALNHFGIKAEHALVIEDSVIGATGGINANIAVWGFTGALGVPDGRAADLTNIGVAKVFANMNAIQHTLGL